MATFRTQPSCNGTVCMEFECALSYHVHLDDVWWNEDKMRRIVTLSAYRGNIYITTVVVNTHIIKVWKGSIECLHNTTTPTCSIGAPNLLLEKSVYSSGELAGDPWPSISFDYKRMPVCASLVDSTKLIIACHDLPNNKVIVALSTVTNVVLLFKVPTFSFHSLNALSLNSV
jgi:hypothetical protein